MVRTREVSGIPGRLLRASAARGGVPRRAARATVGRVALLLAAVTGAACRGEPPEVRIGYTSFFGDTSFPAFLNRELERTRPTGGVPIRLVNVDSVVDATRSSPLVWELERAVALVRDARVVAVVGPGGSREALQVAPVYRDAGMPQLVPTATSRLLQGLSSQLFLLAPNDSVQGEFIADFAADRLRARRATIVQVPDEYGVGLAQGAAAALRRRGVRLLDRIIVRGSRDCLTGADSLSYAAVAAQVAVVGQADVVVLATRRVESACLMAALRRRMPRAVFVAGDGTYVEPALFERAGRAAEGAYLVGFWHPASTNSAGREFATRFEADVHRRVRHEEAMFRDAVMVTAAGIRAVGGDRARLGAYLQSLGRSRAAFEGITGAVQFAAPARGPLLMLQVRGGDGVVVP